MLSNAKKVVLQAVDVSETFLEVYLGMLIKFNCLMLG